MNNKVNLLLITGIPGTGKTEISNYLKDNHGFQHLDREITDSWPPQLEDRIEWVKNQIAALEPHSNGIVISWGFMPGYDEKEIRQLRQVGFKLFWFDGNRPAARQAFIKRNTVGIDLLDIQMQRIESLDLDAINPIIFNTFDEHGVFLKKDEIAKKLLEN